MAWNRQTNAVRKIVVEVRKDGNSTAQEFDSNVIVEDAFDEMANRTGLKTFIAKDARGNEIDEDQAEAELGEFEGPIVLIPKAAGSY